MELLFAKLQEEHYVFFTVNERMNFIYEYSPPFAYQISCLNQSKKQINQIVLRKNLSRLLFD